MTRWVAIFEDNSEADAGWARRQHAEAHFADLAEHRDKIRIGGGLRPAPSDWFCGGLRVMELADRAEAVALCENDPCFRLGLRKGYRLFVWGKAPCYQTVEL